MTPVRSALDQAKPATSPAPRRIAVDFWRGFVLCTILINHMPGTIYERLTFRNYGFSDSAEAFVFISGLSVALAYGRRFARGETGAVVMSLGRRTAKLYAVHIALSLAGIAVFAVGAAVFKSADLMEPHGRELVLEDPWAAWVGLVSLGHQFGYFNILPLYILLLAFAPVLMLLSRLGVGTMLVASITLYVVARSTGLNIPTWPMRGEWFFNPFAWQLLMAIGIACGLELHRPAHRANRFIVAGAAAVVAVCAFCATDGFGSWPGLFDAMRNTADLDKTSLGLGRLLHFLCLAYLVTRLRIAEAMQAQPWFAPLCQLGRHGLSIFAILSLLAAVGQVLTEGFGHSPLLDSTVVLGALAVLLGCARMLDAHSRRAMPAFACGRLPVSGRTTL